MMKSGAPPDKFGVLYCLLPIEFHGFTSRINSKDYHSLVPGLISIFLETVWVPLILSVPVCSRWGTMIMKSTASSWDSFGPAPWIPTLANNMKPFYYWLRDYNLRKYLCITQPLLYNSLY